MIELARELGWSLDDFVVQTRERWAELLEREASAARALAEYRHGLAQPDLPICTRCRDHASFELIDGEWFSECCGARPMDPDPPEYDK